VSIAFLYPGQGAQRPGFLHRLPDIQAVRDTLLEAGAVLDRDPLQLDSAAALRSTVAVQLSLLIAGVAGTRALAAHAVLPTFVAGHSVGAVAGAVAAGVLTFADALRFVFVRAQCMQDSYPRDFGMAAIVGLNESEVRRIIDDLGDSEARIYIAAINSPRQIVISGARASLEAAVHCARRSGAQGAAVLSVSVPSHCNLLSNVSDQLRRELQSVKLAEPQIRYICTHTARAALAAEDVREDLIRGVARTVLWHDSTRILVEFGVRLFIEVPPGTVLTHLTNSAFTDLQAVAMDNTSLDSVAFLAMRQRHSRFG
jgi:malonate decarboxylase epsilon subunit